jgi:hypothetical protein
LQRTDRPNFSWPATLPTLKYLFDALMPRAIVVIGPRKPRPLLDAVRSRWTSKHLQTMVSKWASPLTGIANSQPDHRQSCCRANKTAASRNCRLHSPWCEDAARCAHDYQGSISRASEFGSLVTDAFSLVSNQPSDSGDERKIIGLRELLMNAASDRIPAPEDNKSQRTSPHRYNELECLSSCQ